MKVAGKKIPRGNVLLFFSFTAISLCLLLIVSAVRAERVNRLNKYTMYSGHQRGFSISGGDGAEQWDPVISELVSKEEHFTLYAPIEDPGMIVRGICTRGDAREAPMVWGKYFDFSTSWTDTPRAVLGSCYAEDMVERDGKKYYRFHEVDFEVIGIIGTGDKSRLDQMLLIDFKSAIGITGVETNYVLDGEKGDLLRISQQIYDNMPFPSSVLIALEETEPVSFVERLLAPDVILDTMYIMILVSFSLSTVLVTLIWLRFRRQLFFAWKLCGYERRSERMEIFRRFYVVAGAGFGMGLALMCVIVWAVLEIHLALYDMFSALAITVGLGTLILFFCYFLNRRKDKGE